ncbi:hypothetical protein [Actinophytocola sp. NPDC049390]|uniref:hypothetical protein n=1 Tax=Actinophytocola sp. NPDC049390 TaxID=3363894 RepID=UPI00378A4E2A
MRRLSRTLVVGLLSGALIGLVGAIAALGNTLGFGLALGVVHGAGITFGGGAFEPSRVQFRLRVEDHVLPAEAVANRELGS